MRSRRGLDQVPASFSFMHLYESNALVKLYQKVDFRCVLRSIAYTVYTKVNAVYTVTEGAIMASPVLSFRLEEELVSQLDKLAEATDRDRLYHVKRAMSRYLEAESWHLEAIDVGIEAADAGNLTELSAVKAKWVSRAENRNNRSSSE